METFNRNMHHTDIGGAGQVLASGGGSGGSLIGSIIPFPSSRETRQAMADPRPSIAERYASKDDYLERVRQVAEQLVQERYLLDRDVNVCLAQASKFWDYFAKGKHS